MILERLKDLRIGRKLRQSDMADFLQIDRTTYVKYETGASEPPLLSLIQLAEFFGVSVDYIIGRNTVNYPDEEARLLEIFRQLNPAGRQYLLKNAQFALEDRAYRQDAASPLAM